jgi:galactokinase/mevalonate kinase-like predicted kinase
MIARSWKLNNALDSGTNTPGIQQIIDRIKTHTNGFKLLGAGGGGYMLIAAKDPASAVRIQEILNQDPPNSKARFVKMEVSSKGFQVSRS